MLFDKEFDIDNRSSCSLASDDSNSSHSMVLRSSCKSSKCTAGEHCVSAMRHKRKLINLHLSASPRLINTDICATSAFICEKDSLKDVCEHNENINRVTHCEKEVSWEKDKQLFSERDTATSVSTIPICSHRSLGIASCERDTKVSYHSASCELNGDRMSRTIYKRNALARALYSTESTENEHTSFLFDGLVHRNNHSNESHITQARLMSEATKSQQKLQDSSISPIHRRSGSSEAGRHYLLQSSLTQSMLEDTGGSFDDVDILNTEESSCTIQSQQGAFWSFFSWRKYLYFALSKPTHYDVELLARIARYGKLKTIAFLLLPLLLVLFSSMCYKGSLFSSQKTETEMQSSDFYFVRKLWSLLGFFSYFIPSSKITVAHCGNSQSRGQEKSCMSEENSEAGETLNYAFEATKKAVQNNKFISDHQGIEKLALNLHHGEKRMSDFHTNAKLFFNIQQNNEELDSNFQVIAKEEIKLLVREVLREEIDTEVLMKKLKQDKINSEEMEKIQKELNGFGLKLEAFSGVLQSLKEKSKTEMQKASKFHDEDVQKGQQLREISDKLKHLENQFVTLGAMLNNVKNCCLNGTQLEEKFAATLLGLMDEDVNNPALKPFKEWLSSKYISKQNLHSELKNIQGFIKTQDESTKTAVKKFVEQHIDTVRVELAAQMAKFDQGSQTGSTLSAAAVHKIVEEALMIYDADKTNQTDFALESGGGAVVNTRCSETYNEGRPSVVIFGIPLWNLQSSPRNAIQPDVHPGQCWAFKGSQGYLVIELSATIRPTSFVIEHISKSVAPTGSIDSAPKDFSVWGLSSERDTDGKLLGEYVYDKDGPPLQHFPIQVDDSSYYRYVEIQIHSNHGNMKYTCLYRFRVHGVRL